MSKEGIRAKYQYDWFPPDSSNAGETMPKKYMAKAGKLFSFIVFALFIYAIALWVHRYDRDAVDSAIRFFDGSFHTYSPDIPEKSAAPLIMRALQTLEPERSRWDILCKTVKTSESPELDALCKEFASFALPLLKQAKSLRSNSLLPEAIFSHPKNKLVLKRLARLLLIIRGYAYREGAVRMHEMAVILYELARKINPHKLEKMMRLHCDYLLTASKLERESKQPVDMLIKQSACTAMVNATAQTVKYLSLTHIMATMQDSSGKPLFSTLFSSFFRYRKTHVFLNESRQMEKTLNLFEMNITSLTTELDSCIGSTAKHPGGITDVLNTVLKTVKEVMKR